jgi:hypothetical protein
MFKRKPTFEDQALEAEAQKILDAMHEYGPDSPEYPVLIERYKALDELRPKRTWRVSPDTLVYCGANLVGILIVVIYEKHDVWTTKAMTLTVKPPK